MSLARRDADVEALVTDRYLEALLIALDRRAADAPSDATLDPSVRATARRLSKDLSRVHPSFRFEERLAARLADEAARMRLQGAVPVGPTEGAAGFDASIRLTNQVPPPALHASGRLGDVAAATPDPAADPAADSAPERAAHPTVVVRPLLIGGALTSAALAGAAWLAWRSGRVPVGLRSGRITSPQRLG